MLYGSSALLACHILQTSLLYSTVLVHSVVKASNVWFASSSLDAFLKDAEELSQKLWVQYRNHLVKWFGPSSKKSDYIIIKVFSGLKIQEYLRRKSVPLGFFMC